MNLRGGVCFKTTQITLSLKMKRLEKFLKEEG
jgi:hypothetical protein